MRRAILGLLALTLSACTVSTTRRQPLPKDEGPAGRRTSGGPIHYSGSNDAPEISRSVGKPGGVVVLWPRILPKTDDPKVIELAARVQARLGAIAGAASTDVERRPQPERVCPKGEGCKAVSLGAVLAKKDEGCAVVALVGPPGVKPVTLVPLAGTVKLDAETSPFREPPENLVVVQEFVPCEKLLADLDQNVTLEGQASVENALKAAQ